MKRIHCKPIPVMKIGFSLCNISIREKPVFITGIPATENRFFPVWKYYTGKSLFWPCTDPVRDCSEDTVSLICDAESKLEHATRKAKHNVANTFAVLD